MAFLGATHSGCIPDYFWVPVQVGDAPFTGSQTMSVPIYPVQ